MHAKGCGMPPAGPLAPAARLPRVLHGMPTGRHVAAAAMPQLLVLHCIGALRLEMEPPVAIHMRAHGHASYCAFLACQRQTQTPPENA